MRGLRVALLVAALVSSAAIVCVAVLPGPRFEYQIPALHVVLLTAASMASLLAGLLVIGRFRRRGRLGDLVLACALAVATLANLAPLSALLVTGQDSQPLTAVVAQAGRLFSAVLVAVAAFAPDHRLRRPRSAAIAAVLLIATLFAAVVITDLNLWHTVQGLTSPPPVAGEPRLATNPVLLTEQLGGALFYAAAALGFLTRSLRYQDEFLGWVALAAVLAAASRVSYFLYAPSPPQGVSVGDAFRLASYAALLTGSLREILAYWHTLAETASVRERSRIARDLHDGVAQDLAYLTRHLDSLNGSADPETVERLRRAAQRAQLEARRAIGALASPAAQTLETALAGAAGEIAEQFQTRLDLSLANGIRLPEARAEALLRIACEAVANAARHSGASQVSLTLERHGSRVRLRVSDAGCGFDSAAAAGGFGLVSMRERALSAGGELRVSSAAGKGSQVEAIL
jgi:signal transduction histidine kinase